MIEDTNRDGEEQNAPDGFIVLLLGAGVGDGRISFSSFKLDVGVSEEDGSIVSSGNKGARFTPKGKSERKSEDVESLIVPLIDRS